MPKVSIGLPVYNGDQYLCEAIDSLLAQTFTDFELIIADNASTDNTEAICREYAIKDPRVVYYRREINYGARDNYLFVLEKAVGQYFMWAASDDMWSCSWIEELLGESGPEWLCVCGRVKIIGLEKDVLIKPDSFSVGQYVSFMFNNRNKAMYMYGLFQSSQLKELSTIFDSLPVSGGDHALLQYGLFVGGLKSIDKTEMSYRIHDSQESYQVRKRNGRILSVVFNLGMLRQYLFHLKHASYFTRLILLSVVPFHYLLFMAMNLKGLWSRVG